MVPVTPPASRCPRCPQLHDAYSRVCRRQQLCAVDQAECLALVTLLEARGVLQIKRAKEARLAKVGRFVGGGAPPEPPLLWR